MTSENSTIIALLFSQTEISHGIYESIHQFHNDGKIEVKDVCEFEVKENGKIKFERAMMLPLIGSGDEIFLEAFVGLIFFNAPHSENVTRAISEIRLDTKFIDKVTEAAVPGSSVLFVHISGRPDEASLQQLAPQADQILSMPLMPEQESKLEILFHGGSPQSEASMQPSLH